MEKWLDMIILGSEKGEIIILLATKRAKSFELGSKKGQ